MAIYEYRCEQDGVFEINLPIGTAPGSTPCPVCASAAPRIVSAPMLMTAKRTALSAALDRADKSRYEPEVVNRLPPSAAPSRTLALTPTLRGLPRP